MLEQLFPASWIERKAWFAFILGFVYTVFGLGFALLIFPEDPALPAIAFTSLLILPVLIKIFSIETKQAAAERRFDLSDSFKNHKDVFAVYLFLFLGIFSVFALFSLLLPSITTNQLFSEQLEAVGLTGRATGLGDFESIVSNNLLIFIFALLASFVYGSGAIFILTWNASAWGVVFGVIAKDIAAVAGVNPFVYFGLTMLAVGPHLVTEAGAYILVAISGGIVSKAVMTERLFSSRFKKIIKDALVIFAVAVILLLGAAYIETFVTGSIYRILGI
jgi:uncharacterized membrane protein SpoIIM required for sporulation